MSMDMLASLLRELLKDIRALQARTQGEALPGAVSPEAAAKIIGCSLKTLQTEIRRGRVQTVRVDDREHVPMSEIARLASLRKAESERAKAARKLQRRKTTPQTGRSTRRPKPRGGGRAGD